MKLIAFLILTLIGINVAAQSDTAVNCKSSLKGYISDGLEYPINFKDISKFDVIFYPGFSYRLVLCTDVKEQKFELVIIDEKNNTQYSSNITNDYSRDFRFETLFHGQIIIKSISTNNRSAQLLIGYKKID